MNTKVFDNFIGQQECDELVRDFEKFIRKDLYRFHGGRRLVSSTSPEYVDLVNNSKAWRDLSILLSSDKFLERCLRDLDISNKYLITRFVSRLGRRLASWRKRLLVPIRNTSLVTAVTWYAYSYGIKLALYVASSITRIRGKELVEFLFDASSSSNGYSREIHRDSDSRVFVLLLYLNEMSEGEGATGGDLRMYVPKQDGVVLDPQPHSNQVREIERIRPKSGRLVIFENTHDAYHDVSLMDGYHGERYFCYGSLTLLSGRNRRLPSVGRRLTTDIKMYL